MMGWATLRRFFLRDQQQTSSSEGGCDETPSPNEATASGSAVALEDLDVDVLLQIAALTGDPVSLASLASCSRRLRALLEENDGPWWHCVERFWGPLHLPDEPFFDSSGEPTEWLSKVLSVSTSNLDRDGNGAGIGLYGRVMDCLPPSVRGTRVPRLRNRRAAPVSVIHGDVDPPYVRNTWRALARVLHTWVAPNLCEGRIASAALLLRVADVADVLHSAAALEEHRRRKRRGHGGGDNNNNNNSNRASPPPSSSSSGDDSDFEEDFHVETGGGGEGGVCGGGGREDDAAGGVRGRLRLYPLALRMAAGVAARRRATRFIVDAAVRGASLAVVAGEDHGRGGGGGGDSFDQFKAPAEAVLASIDMRGLDALEAIRSVLLVFPFLPMEAGGNAFQLISLVARAHVEQNRRWIGRMRRGGGRGGGGAPDNGSAAGPARVSDGAAEHALLGDDGDSGAPSMASMSASASAAASWRLRQQQPQRPPAAPPPSPPALTVDATVVLMYGLIMLNTDLHNPQVRVKMTEGEWVKSLSRTELRGMLEEASARGYYRSLIAKPLHLGSDETRFPL